MWFGRLATFLLLGCGAALGQTTTRFYLEKSSFAPREPVFLYLSVQNEGVEPVSINYFANPDSPSCSQIVIELSNDPPMRATCSPSQDVIAQCNGAISRLALSPGRTYTRRILLNFHHEIASPGEYTIHATYALALTARDLKGTDLNFRVDGTLPAFDGWAPWVKQLRSPMAEERGEAARVLASSAPISLAGTLLEFAQQAEFRKYAPLAFHRLNTPGAIEALARLVGDSVRSDHEEGVPSEEVEAVRYLGATHDVRWFDVLRDAAERCPKMAAFPAAAAEAGGELMIPDLIRMLQDADFGVQINGLSALGYTGSRTAIPILFERVKNGDFLTQQNANYALQVLTHRTAINDMMHLTPGAEVVAKWSRWMEDEETTAPLFRGLDCGEVRPLP